LTPVISFKGIDDAISGLGYASPRTLKARLVHALRERHAREHSIEGLDAVPTEELIRLLWTTARDPEEIRKKKKNLSSLKSSVNADFKRAFEEGRNPEGILIGPQNTFVLCDAAKDRIVTTVARSMSGAGAASMTRLLDFLGTLNHTLSSGEGPTDPEIADVLSNLDQLKEVVSLLSKRLGILENPCGSAPDVAPFPGAETEQEPMLRADEAEETPEVEIEIEVVPGEEICAAGEGEENTLEELLEGDDLGGASESTGEESPELLVEQVCQTAENTHPEGLPLDEDEEIVEIIEEVEDDRGGRDRVDSAPPPCDESHDTGFLIEETHGGLDDAEIDPGESSGEECEIEVVPGEEVCAAGEGEENTLEELLEGDDLGGAAESTGEESPELLVEQVCQTAENTHPEGLPLDEDEESRTIRASSSKKPTADWTTPKSIPGRAPGRRLNDSGRSRMAATPPQLPGWEKAELVSRSFPLAVMTTLDAGRGRPIAGHENSTVTWQSG